MLIRLIKDDFEKSFTQFSSQVNESGDLSVKLPDFFCLQGNTKAKYCTHSSHGSAINFVLDANRAGLV